jgi:putative peptidoglycan lipid II flippase
MDANTLPLAIESIYQQTYKNIEIIVVNDFSPETDVIDRILKQYPLIAYVKNEVNLGLAASRNEGLKIARGNFIAFLDADDEYHPQKIELQVRHAGDNIAVACDLQVFSEKTQLQKVFENIELVPSELVDGLFKISLFNYLTGASILVSRNLLLKIGGYDVSLRSCEDYDLWLRLIKHGVKVIRLKLPLYFYRLNPNGLSKNNNAISHWELEAVKRNTTSNNANWANKIFNEFIWLIWLFRHLIRAEKSKNILLKNNTLKNSQEYSNSFFICTIIYFANFLRIPSLYLKANSLLSGAEKSLSVLCQSKDIKTDGNRNATGIYLSIPVIWTSFFVYSLVTAILFQLLLPILLPSLHAGNGLLHQDSLFFHQSAMTLADEIRKNGWAVWSIWPNPYLTGNVAILSAIYAIFEYEPVLLLPLNAALHASGGICIMLIGRHLFSGDFARIGSFVAGCFYVFFPSSLNWYAQNHKDEYAALGFLLLLLAGIRLFEPKKWKGFFTVILLSIGGLAFTAFVRPNNLQLFTTLGFGILFIGIFWSLKRKASFIPFVVYASLIFFSATYIKVSPHQESTTPQNIASNFAQSWVWNVTPEIPSVIDNAARKISNIRVFLAANAVRDGAGSMIDTEHMPTNFYDLLSYMPTAGLNGLFAPYPQAWLSKISPFWIIGIMEIAVWYLLFPGMLWLLWKNKGDPVLWWVVLSTFFMISVESFLSANLGTLHRIRYPFIFIFILLGCIGWSNLLKILLAKKYPLSTGSSTTSHYGLPRKAYTKNLKSTYKSLPLIVFTALLYLALFFRDILFAHVFGLSSELDSYQYAANLPLAAAALLAVPLCPALMVQFEKLRQRDHDLARYWVNSMAGSLLISFFVIGLLTLIVSMGGSNEGVLNSYKSLSIWFFPVVFLSGITVLGNAILICNNKAALATAFQITVPLLGIVFAYFFAERGLGIMAPVGGVVFGQAINLILVAYFCRKCGFPISPRLGSICWPEWIPTYASLVVSSAVSVLSAPIALYFSYRLSAGATATLYMGSKIFQAISIFVASIFISLVLPYFISLVTLKQIRRANEEFVNLLIVSMLIAILVSLLVSFSAPEIASFFFLGKKIGDEQVDNVSLVIQIGLLQLPFFVASLTIIKFFIATQKVLIIVVAALVGLVLNCCLSWLITYQNLGVEMLALSMAFSLASTSIILFIWAKYQEILSWKEIYLFLLMLLIFMSMSLSIILINYSALLVSFVAFMILLVLSRSLKNKSLLTLYTA